jgi:hypothetical protein
MAAPAGFLLTEDVYPIRGSVIGVVAPDALYDGGSQDQVEVDLAMPPSKWIPLGPAAIAGLVLSCEDGLVVHVTTRAITVLPTPGVTHVRAVCRVSSTVPEAEDLLETLTRKQVLLQALQPGVRVTVQAPLLGPDEPTKPPVEQSELELLSTIKWLHRVWILKPDGGADGAEAKDGDDAGGGGDEEGGEDDDDDAATATADPLKTVFKIVGVGVPTPLSCTSRAEQIQDACTLFLDFMGSMEFRCKALGIIGSGTEQAQARSRDFRHLLALYARAFETARCLVEVQSARNSDFDPDTVSYNNISVQATISTTAPAERELWLFSYLLNALGSLRLRRVDTTVYAERMVPDTAALTWRAARCAEPQCTAYHRHVMFGDPYGGPEGPRWCLDHAALRLRAGLPTANMVFQTAAARMRVDPAVSRSWSAAAPRWLVQTRPLGAPLGCKTWVPRITQGQSTHTENGRFSAALNLHPPQTISQLVSSILDNRLTRTQVWKMFQQSHSTLANLTTRLTTVNDPAFPVHCPIQHLIAFVNGILCISTMEFCSFERLSARHPDWSTAGAVNFVKEWFDPLWLVQPLGTLAVPGYDDILSTQQFTEDTVELLDALLGRLFFPVNYRDHMQIMPVMLGTGGSGKSTIAKAIINILGAANVAILPSTVEVIFGMMGLSGKRLIICPEMKEDFNMPMGNLQSMICGESTAVAEKNKGRSQVDAWGVPILLLGNAVPIAFMQDTGGAMERRSVVFRMDVKPATQDPMLGVRFMNNLGPFLVRTLRRYHELVQTYGVDGQEDGARDFRKNRIGRNPQLLAFQAAFQNETSTAVAFREALSANFVIGINEVEGADVGGGGGGAGGGGGVPAPAAAGAAAAAGTAMASDAPLMELLHWMTRARRGGGVEADGGAGGGAGGGGVKRFAQLAFTTETVQRAVEAARLGTIYSTDRYHSLAKEHRVPIKELSKAFSTWQSENRLTVNKTGTNQKAPPKFKDVLTEMGLPCSTDADDPNPSVTWVYGIRRAAASDPPRGPDE